MLVALACGCDDGGHATATSPSRAPAGLAGGGVPSLLPASLARLRGRAVVGAKEPGASAARSCPVDPSLRRRATFSAAWLTPEGLTVEYRIRGFPSLVACDAVFARGRWLVCGASVARSRDPHRIELAGGGLTVVCDDRARSPSFMWIAVPRRARWTLVDDGKLWTAYRTAHRRLIRVSKAETTRAFHVAFVDDRGRVLHDRRITGAVAG